MINKNNLTGFEKFFTKNKKIIFIVLLLLLAFSIRGHLLKYDYMFEFDTYWHLRMTEYTLTGGVPDYDPLGFYAQGGTTLHHRPMFAWYLTSFLYILFTFGSSLNRELLMEFARFLPAIFGALISLSMYFLGKEIYNRKAGIVMAIVTAAIPAFVYRTMAGFYEEDALGFLWIVIGFIFLVKAIKNIHSTKKSVKYSLISGLFFGLMAFTWSAFILVPLIVISFFVVNLFYMAYKNYSNRDMALFVKVVLISFITFVALASIAQPTWIKSTTNYVLDYVPISKENIDRMHNRGLDDSNVLAVSVGEENVGKKFFLYKYSFLTWIPFVVLILMPLYLLFSRKRDNLTLLIFFWLLITFLMAWSKLKFTFYLGIPIAAGTGFLFYVLDNWVRKKNSLLFKRIFAVFIGIILLSTVAAGTHEVYTKVPHIVEKDDWRESIFWIAENTSKDAKLFNWWDYGHWLTYFTERRVSSDNTNSRMEANSDFSLFILSQDINFTKDIMKKYDTDYFIADNTYFNRYTSFGSYGFLTINYQDPRIKAYISLSNDCRYGFIKEGVTGYVCRENVFTEETMNQLPTEWNDSPVDVINGIPFYVYRLEDNSKIFFLNESANNSTFAKIWFNEKEHSEIFSKVYENGNVRIYNIIKEKLE